jgi:hypothetical protein
MDIIELTKWVVHRGDDLYSLDKQVQFKQKIQKYFAEQLRIDGVSKSFPDEIYATKITNND